MDFINEYMQTYFDEVTPYEFYRGIFAPGELEQNGVYEQGKYNAIAVELIPRKEVEKSKSKTNAKRYVITDGLEILDKLLESENFIIVSPISYSGKSRVSNNARYIYAMAIDLDGVDEQAYLTDLMHQINNDFLPVPTYMVSSGTGIHLYYQFENPIPCFANVTKQLGILKDALTKRIWNKYTTSLADKPQIQSLFQGFRLVGGVTKSGSRTRAYETGKKVSIEYLNDFVADENKVTSIVYKSNLTLNKAKELYPEWYDKRIIQKQKKGTWTCKRDLYDWWLRRLKAEITEGHRFNGIMVLSVYARKCNIDYQELEKDAYDLFDLMESMTVREDNHFTREDIMSALEMYNDNYITYPIDSIVQRTGIEIKKNKRNYRTRATHIRIVNQTRKFIRDELGENPYKNNGRKTKQDIVIEWRLEHLDGTKADCIRDTGLSKPTVYKWWK